MDRNRPGTLLLAMTCNRFPLAMSLLSRRQFVRIGPTQVRFLLACETFAIPRPLGFTKVFSRLLGDVQSCFHALAGSSAGRPMQPRRDPKEPWDPPDADSAAQGNIAFWALRQGNHQFTMVFQRVLISPPGDIKSVCSIRFPKLFQETIVCF